MPPEDRRAAAMLEEIAWLRAQVERVRALPVGTIAVEGMMMQYERLESEPGSVHESGTIASTIGAWRFEQSHRHAHTSRWHTCVAITPVTEDDHRE